MTTVLPPRRPLLPPPLYLLLSLGLGLGVFLGGLLVMALIMVLLWITPRMLTEFPVAVTTLLILMVVAPNTLGWWHLRRALIEAQHAHSGPFWGGPADLVRRGAHNLLAAIGGSVLLVVLLVTLRSWTPSDFLAGLGPLNAELALSAGVAWLTWITMPLLLLGLADWMDRGGQLVDRQREVV